MTVVYLKRGKAFSNLAEDESKTKLVVEKTLADIEKNGDAAVKEL